MKIYCDLAADLKSGVGSFPKGVTRNLIQGRYGIVREDITLEKRAEEETGKPAGEYYSLKCGFEKLKDAETRNYLSKSVAKALKDLILLKKFDKKISALVVGLGNSYMTADSLGGRTISGILTTRQLKSNVLNDVSAISGGVSGITGIGSYEIALGLVKQINPDILICVDSLCALSADRVGSIYQFTDTGILPGGKNGTDGIKIDAETVGIPVIGIGVPTVVSAYKLVETVLKEEGITDDEAVDKKFGKIAGGFCGDLFVTPKEINDIIDKTSYVLALGINYALQNSLSFEEVAELTPRRI